MEPTEKKLYLEIKKGEKSDVKPNGFGDFISEMKKVDQNEKARIEGNRLFYENRENEILSFHKKIVEAKTLNELSEVRKLIKNRISALNHKACEKFSELNNTLSRLKDLLQITDEEITAFKPEVNDKRKNSKPKFSHTYIALKCFYKDIAITDKNAERIAKIYGYVAPYSGIKLKRNYEHYRSIQNRTNHPGAKKFKNMVNDLESIIKDLPQKKWKQGNPIKELDKLRKNSEQ